MITDWFREADAALTVCDKDGQIIYMNDKARNVFEKLAITCGCQSQKLSQRKIVQKIEHMLSTGQSQHLHH